MDIRRSMAVALIVLAAILSREGIAEEFLRVRATGVGYAPASCAGTPRGRLMAERAATVVAARNLASGGLPPRGIVFFQSYVPGVRVVGTTPTPDGGMAATVETSYRIVHFREEYVQW